MRVKQIWTLHLTNTLNFVQETLIDSNTKYEKRKATFSQVNSNAMTHSCTVLQLLEQITPGHPPQQKTGAFHATWLQMIDSSVNNTQGLTWCCKLLVWSTREFVYLGQHLLFFLVFRLVRWSEGALSKHTMSSSWRYCWLIATVNGLFIYFLPYHVAVISDTHSERKVKRQIGNGAEHVFMLRLIATNAGSLRYLWLFDLKDYTLMMSPCLRSKA